jgi:hypothetical protein
MTKEINAWAIVNLKGDLKITWFTSSRYTLSIFRTRKMARQSMTDHYSKVKKVKIIIYE